MSKSKLHFANPLKAVRERFIAFPAVRLLAVLAALALAAALFGVLPVQGQTDTTPPSFQSTFSSTQVLPFGTHINLSFSEVLDDRNPPPASAFTVTADGSNVPVTSAFVSGGFLMGLSLELPIGAGQTVKVSYSDPTPGDDAAAIQDVAGNDAASFTEITIDNDSNRPPLPQNLTATQGTGVVTLSWTIDLTGLPALTRYDYRVSTDMGVNWDPDWTQIPNSASLTSYGVAYTPSAHPTFQLRAVNTEGDGPAAEAELVRTTGVTISKDSLTVPEGGSGSYTIVLGKQPTVPVGVNITAGGDVTTSPTSVTFTDSDWWFPKTVTVNAAQDGDRVDDSVTITHSVTGGSALEYVALTGLDSVDVTVLDDDDRINICDRTSWLRDEILRQTPSNDTCDNVNSREVERITGLDFSELGPGGDGVFHNKLKHDDLRRLIRLTRLDLSGLGLNSFERADGNFGQSLPGGMFSDLTDLEYLSLADNDIYPRLRQDVFDGLSNLTELDLRGFSRNPAGRDGVETTRGSGGILVPVTVGTCWTNQEQAWIHPQYPWNPRTGSPEAFAPLTSLRTYNWDADFDTSRIEHGGGARSCLPS